MTLQKGAFDLSWVKTSEGGVNYDDKKYLSSAFKIYNELYYHQSKMFNAKIVNFAITHWPSQSEAKRTVGPRAWLHIYLSSTPIQISADRPI